MNIKQIDIIQHSYCNFSYTDHPVITAELQKNYMDKVVALCEKTKDRPIEERFSWTSEANAPVWEWWREANSDSKRLFLEAVKRGQLEVCAYPMNLTPLLDENEINKMINWIPAEFWNAFSIKTIMQTAVNGISSSGVIQACKKGAKYLWMGPKSYLGKTPKKTPYIFNWKLSPSDKVFCFVNDGYNNAYNLFFDNWKTKHIPKIAETVYREPDNLDFFRAIDSKTGEYDKDYVVKAYVNLVKKLEARFGEKASDYPFTTLPVSLTNQWRADNDPPFEGVSDFIKVWNEMGLTPKLNLTTVSRALTSIEVEALNSKIPTYSGEWVDWWAKGVASLPLELSAARKAKKIYKHIKTLPIVEKQEEKLADSIITDLCHYSEHSFGSWASVSQPFSPEAKGTMAYKSNYAYKALANAEYLYSTKLRAKIKPEEEGIYLYNPTSVKISDWVTFPADSLRGKYVSFMDKDTLTIEKLYYRSGNSDFHYSENPSHYSEFNYSQTFADKIPKQNAMFWAEVPANTVKYYVPMTIAGGEEHIKEGPEILTDLNGWPVSIEYSNGKKISGSALGEFISVNFKGFAQRQNVEKIFSEQNIEEKAKLLKEKTETNISEFSHVTEEEFENCILIKQSFSNKSLISGKRTIQIWKKEPRIRITVDILRPYKLDPETYYIKFELNNRESAPVISNGGIVFEPSRGQLDGSCMDYYTVDDWVDYPYVGLLWVSKDAPLVSFGGMNYLAQTKEFPKNTGDLYSLVFDNTWDSNFAADACGHMSFSYDILCGDNFDDFTYVKNLAESAVSDTSILSFFR